MGKTVHLNKLSISPKVLGYTPLLLLCLAWSLAVGISLIWNQKLIQQKMIEHAQLQADTIINKDLAYRRWATLHGGVYVRPTEQTPPNPWLNHPKRDVVTTDGDRLTLMNPAYMTRQLMELFGEQYGVKGHITSLNLKNPINAPDQWEREALERFNQGERLVTQLTILDDQRYLRMILPMVMEQGCLKCHADTGIPVGAIRGGISAAVPLAHHELVAAASLKATRLFHGGIWLLGMCLMGGGNSLYRRQKARLQAATGELASSQVRFAALTQASPTGVFQTDPDGLCLFVNDKWCVLAGITPEQAQGNGWTQILHPDDRSLISEAWQRSVNEQRPFSQEYRFIRPDGKITWVYGQSSAMKDPYGVVIGFVGTVTDISEHKEIEKSLLAAKELSEEASRAKSEFMATISHELRTPLNAVMGGAQLLDMTSLSGEQQEYLEMISQGAHQELALVNNLLDLVAIEAGGVSIDQRPLLLHETLHKLINQQQDACMAKGLSLRLEISKDTPDAVLGDVHRITQSLDILLSNAIKFTDQGGVTVSTSLLDRQGSCVTVGISVSDTGIGVPEELQEQIFSPFTQADMSNTRRYGGTGMGLSICRRLAIAMGGRVRLESTAGQGSCFHLELPLAPDLPGTTQTPPDRMDTAGAGNHSGTDEDQGVASSPRCRPDTK